MEVNKTHNLPSTGSLVNYFRLSLNNKRKKDHMRNKNSPVFHLSKQSKLIHLLKKIWNYLDYHI